MNTEATLLARAQIRQWACDHQEQLPALDLLVRIHHGFSVWLPVPQLRHSSDPPAPAGGIPAWWTD